MASIRGEADLDRSLADGHARDLCQVLFARGCGGLIDVASWGEGSAGYYHHIVEAVKIAFADRDEWLSDPGFVDIPLQKLLSNDYADERRALIDPARATDRRGRAGPALRSRCRPPAS
ncbi:gamma-glutamyltransferase [Novilysobacter spongiicola]|uniref:Gamma-glutamyltranspeptidase n=1 Tax=Lysobacter spongiicola DSM 21749 TaxID=1122188 RepID=A0A1T4M0Z5_9GAMM|nr:gamma-glutamyltransferase [Lysobacter spongiicola]SJZ60660.1 Gamma-glutamyltranspeptidase [Lysobacter spongiicola DSM 21749]